MKAKTLIQRPLKHKKFEDAVAVISKDASCDGCIFKNTKGCTFVACSQNEREDGQYVIFKWKKE